MAYRKDPTKSKKIRGGFSPSDRFQICLENHWKNPRRLITLLLSPLSWLYRSVVQLRSCFYHLPGCRPVPYSIPVVIIGNLHSGGVGKTPTVIALAQALKNRKLRVGIVSRGYGRNNAGLLLVDTCANAVNYGDEPLLIARKTGCPTVVARQRKKAVEYLLNNFPDLDIILSDDGLQHYALARDIEVVVFPYADLGKSLRSLPAGPLREPISRLKTVPFIILSNAPSAHLPKATIQKQLNVSAKHIFFSHILKETFYQLSDPVRQISSDFFKDKRVLAACAIANPDRFFTLLKTINSSSLETISFPDHQILPLECLAKAFECVIITEKDAVKYSGRPLKNVFVCSVATFLDEDFIAAFLQYFDGKCKEKIGNG
ncbi:MAG: tetraacyldisaccharide 4'-kinase [Neisseriaceae bacterium]